MSMKTTLLLAPALAPVTGSDAQACAIRDLARALQKNGWQVNIVLGIDNQCDTSRVGLARRLEPVAINNTNYSIHQGNIESGDIQLLAVEGSNRPTSRVCLDIALSLFGKPDVIQVWSQTRNVLPYVDTLEAPPLRIVHLSQASTSTGAMREQLAHAELLLLSSKADAKAEQKKKTSHWAELTPKLQGLTPGANLREWNPARDSLLSQRMTPPDTENKNKAKQALRAELGLADLDQPLIGIVSKLPTLSKATMDEWLSLQTQFVGIGDTGVDTMAVRAPSQVASPKISSDYEQKRMQHRIVAAADFILMPATPSPISQLYPCQYGTAIVAPKCGEFAERIVNFDPQTKTGSGFLYKEHHEITHAIRNAIAVWQLGNDTRSALIERCLQLDLSWETTAMRLIELVETYQPEKMT